MYIIYIGSFPFLSNLTFVMMAMLVQVHGGQQGLLRDRYFLSFSSIYYSTILPTLHHKSLYIVHLSMDSIEKVIIYLFIHEVFFFCSHTFH